MLHFDSEQPECPTTGGGEVWHPCMICNQSFLCGLPKETILTDISQQESEAKSSRGFLGVLNSKEEGGDIGQALENLL